MWMKKVSVCGKGGSGKSTIMYNLWREAFEEVVADYSEIETEFNYVDAITT
jgi:isocitrate/isopropylmalate dehydrogenase